MNRKQIFIFIFLLFIATSLQAYNRKDFIKIRGGDDCPNCDLSGVNLSQRDLHGIDLSGANLRNTIFTGANLSKANLEGANIHGAKFSNAKLRRTIWVDGKRCSAKAIGRCLDKR